MFLYILSNFVQMATKLWAWLQFNSTSNSTSLSGRLRYHPHIQVWHHPVSLGTRTVKPMSRLQNGHFKIPMGDVTITPSIGDCTEEHKQRSNLKGKEGLPLLRLCSGWKAGFISALTILPAWLPGNTSTGLFAPARRSAN